MPGFDVSFSLSEAEELRSLLSGAGFDRIRIAERSLDVTLESADLFVKLTVQGAAASIPAFARLDVPAQSALVDAVAQEVDTVVRCYRRGDELIFPMHTNIALAC
jgi:hypothetical protein